MNIQGKVYQVGGCVRDYLMKIDPKDYDYVVVGGSQENLLSLGFKQVGADFPVFLHPETGEEYALARVERKSGLGYNGFVVNTENVTLEEDLARRDFTINAMAMDGETVYDPFGGISDIRTGIIRHVGDAFKDDPLRALRAARFAARYDFDIDKSTIHEIRSIPREDLQAISLERVFIEIKKAITDGHFKDFMAHLRFMNIDWVVEPIVGTLSSFVPKINTTDVDTFLIGLFIKYGQTPTFNGVAYHKKIATMWDNYCVQSSYEALVTLAMKIGKYDSPVATALTNALSVCSGDHGSYYKLFVKSVCLICHSISSEDALKIDPTLAGPALGAAIKQLRIDALRKFLA